MKCENLLTARSCNMPKFLCHIMIVFTVSISFVMESSTFARGESLVVGVMKDAKPGSWRNEKGELTGFSVDVARALCTSMSVTCSFNETNSMQELIDAVANNRVDFVSASLLETPERSAKMLFTTPYFRSSSYLIARQGVSLSTSGLRVVVLKGAVQMNYIQSRLAGNQRMVLADTVTVIVNALEQGRADASLLAMFQAINILSQPKLIELGFTVTPIVAPELTGDAKIGVTRTKPQLRDRLNEALKEIRSNGTLEKINSRHMPFRVL